jgi:hypothetical protein
MPSHSPAQKRTMAAIAHGWRPPAASGIHIPVSVAKEFNDADKSASLARAHATVNALRKKKP